MLFFIKFDADIDIILIHFYQFNVAIIVTGIIRRFNYIRQIINVFGSCIVLSFDQMCKKSFVTINGKCVRVGRKSPPTVA